MYQDGTRICLWRLPVLLLLLWWQLPGGLGQTTAVKSTASVLSTTPSSMMAAGSKTFPPTSATTSITTANPALTITGGASSHFADPKSLALEAVESARTSSTCKTTDLAINTASSSEMDKMASDLRPELKSISDAAGVISSLQRSLRGEMKDGRDDMYNALLNTLLLRHSIIMKSCVGIINSHFNDTMSTYTCVYRKSQIGNSTDDGGDTNVSSQSEPNEWFWSLIGANNTSAGSQESFAVGRDYWSNITLVCGRQRKWKVTFSTPVYSEGKGRLKSGAVQADFDLSSVDINQCPGSTTIFADTHKCRNPSTECVPIPGQAFRRGSYYCQCRKGYYFPDPTVNKTFFDGTVVEEEYLRWRRGKRTAYPKSFECLPCAEGCDSCLDGSPCVVREDQVLRTIVTGIQCLSVVVCLVLGVVAFKHRKTKSVEAFGPWLLLLLLFGTVLLYSPVIVLYFRPIAATCLLLFWFRELGFALAYGVLVLRARRYLEVFQTRSATQLELSDKGLLKLLAAIVLVALGLLFAGTACTIQEARAGLSIVSVDGRTGSGLKFPYCSLSLWSYCLDIGELLFLVWGLYQCYRIRSAPSEFNEPLFMTIAIGNEALLTFIFNVARHAVLPIIHPDVTYLAHFLHSQLTVTVMVGIIFIPKLRHIGQAERQRRDFRSRKFRARSYAPGLELDNAIPRTQTNGSICEQAVDPSELREELKRVYQELEVYKLKTMMMNNRHIRKKKGRRRPLIAMLTSRASDEDSGGGRDSSFDTPSEQRTITPEPRDR
ncbi:GPR158 [Branchiostoma lanceolatum]|uniref:GPR158 protein n=1 Tax=Branchiostoma lanceolatum TaxID=7740 RepID=A0A8J9ZA82_BRALA|nr:GPR158 [Branchiostoma lanceolatum]